MATGRRHETAHGRAVAYSLLRGEDPPAHGPLTWGSPHAWLAFDLAARSAVAYHGHGHEPQRPAAQGGPATRSAVAYHGHEPQRPVVLGGPAAVRPVAPGSPAVDLHLALRACHPDGRVREAALRTRQVPLPLIVIRCADWVPAVRARARRELVLALAGYPELTLSATVPLALRLGGREQGAWVVELFEAALHHRPPRLAQWWRVGLLTGPPRRRTADAILTGLRGSTDPATRRFATRIVLGRGAAGVRELARAAAAERDPVTARMWTDAALQALAAGGPRGKAAGRANHDAVDALL
ncbi:hypothetical protein GPJ59_28440, partial [Streptomyces bambusae]|nr:hypothetical protein [Streptomyces bambusae]